MDGQISVNDHEGSVQRIVIRNSDIYTNSVLVRTAHEKSRSEYDIGIGYRDGIQ